MVFLVHIITVALCDSQVLVHFSTYMSFLHFSMHIEKPFYQI